MEILRRAPCRPLRWLLAGLMAVCLPLQGLAVGMGSVRAPAHFHTEEPAHGHRHADDDHAHGAPHGPPHEPPHGPPHEHARGQAHAAVGHHSHDFDDEGVVYLAAPQDGEAGSVATAKPLPAGLEAAGPVAGVPALPRAAAAPPRASPAAFRSRSVAPPEHPPR